MGEAYGADDSHSDLDCRISNRRNVLPLDTLPKVDGRADESAHRPYQGTSAAGSADHVKKSSSLAGLLLFVSISRLVPINTRYRTLF